MFSTQTSRTKSRPRAGYGLLLAVLLAGFALVSGRAEAGAVPLTIEEMTAIADEIVTVEVVETRSRVWNGRIVTDVEFEVLENFKGSMTGHQTITHQGGRYAGLVQHVPAIPSYRKGEQAILFLSRPFDRLSEQDKARFNPESPLVSSPQTVGGRQGKLGLERTAGYATPDWDKNSGIGVDKAAKVSPGVATRSPQLPSAAPNYEQFSSALRDLANEQKSLKDNNESLKQIPGVYGVFSVPKRTSSATLRHFDPLPQMAYYDDEMLDALRRAAEKQQVEDLTEEEKAAIARQWHGIEGDE